MKKFRGFIVMLCIGVMLPAALAAQTTVNIRILLNYISGLSSPVLVTHAGDGSRRIFIVQQGGIIKVANAGSSQTTNFMNITSKVLSGSERGLLGLAFHPDFKNNRYFFVDYTRLSDGATVIARYTANASLTAGDPASERILMTIAQPFSNHNGGMIAFGPDGNLYIGMGDGGSGNDPGNRAQNINQHLGKFLRITPDVANPPAAQPYSIPADNPYVGVDGLDEIYAIGVRNPWRWSFDRGGTHQLWAGDVGQGAREEVDIITLGGNYGWRVYEGNQCTGLDPSLCTPANYTAPVFDYGRSAGDCAVTGGYVYRGPAMALPDGAYIYSDYCTGNIRVWYANQQISLLDTSRSIVSFGEDEAGELYIVGLGGTIDKVLGRRTSADFDGDDATNVSIFRPSNGVWYIYNQNNGTASILAFGAPGDIPVPEDYDGDNKADHAVFRPSNGTWYFRNSTNGTMSGAQFGMAGDVPVTGDFNGDLKADLTVFRASESSWYTYSPATGQTSITSFGVGGDIPVAADYDGDGTTDIAVFRPSDGRWYFDQGPGNVGVYQFGTDGDIPAPADYDADGKADIAVFRPSTGVWYILRSATQDFYIMHFGMNGDVPAAGDYDGDGKDDIAVYRNSTGEWYFLRSSDGGFTGMAFGLPGDVPVPAVDIP
jgi:glucose/arabinose dehydrogenase